MWAFYTGKKTIRPLAIFHRRNDAAVLIHLPKWSRYRGVLRRVEVNEFELFDLFEAGLGYPNKNTNPELLNNKPQDN